MRDVGPRMLTDTTKNEGYKEPGSIYNEKYQMSQCGHSEKSDERNCCWLVWQVLKEDNLSTIHHRSVGSVSTHLDTKIRDGCM